MQDLQDLQPFLCVDPTAVPSHLAPFAFPLSATPNYLSCIRCDVVFKISLRCFFLKAPQLLHDSSIARLSRVQFIFPVAAFAHPVLLPIDGRIPFEYFPLHAFDRVSLQCAKLKTMIFHAAEDSAFCNV